MAIPPDPEEATAASAPAVASIPPHTRPGAVHLTVADLQRSVDYYTTAVGLTVRERAGKRAALGAGGEDLLVLEHQPGARPSDGYAGLYHFALLVPERVDLARWLAHAARERVALVGLSDHFVSEAIYLSDPDHHGIEIYWDRPRQLWEGQVAQRMTTLSLDVQNLFTELGDPASEPFAGLPAATRMGHVHLRVADIERTVTFYRDLLGFALMAALGGQAAFLSAGGYHHHIGANTWESAGAPQPPDGAARLKQATILLPSEAARVELADRLLTAGHRSEPTRDGVLVPDPSGNPIVLAVAAPRGDRVPARAGEPR